MRRAGAVTLAQNEQSSVVYGMPKEAGRKGAVLVELDPPGMIKQLRTIGKKHAPKTAS